MAVSVVQEGETLRLSTPMPLFDQRSRSEDGTYQEYAISTGAGLRFDIFPDGSRFVMVRTAESSASEIVLARNIAQELRAGRD